MPLFYAWGLHFFIVNYLEIERHNFSVLFLLSVIRIKMVETRVVIIQGHQAHFDNVTT